MYIELIIHFGAEEERMLCVVTIVSLSELKGMCTFSSSAQHDIVYLYNDVSIKCILL